MSNVFYFPWEVKSPSAKPPFLEDQFVFLSLASLLRPVRLGRPYQERTVPASIFRKVIEARKHPPSHHDRVEKFGGESNFNREIILRQFNPLNSELNLICHLLALLVAHHILHVSGLGVKLQKDCAKRKWSDESEGSGHHGQFCPGVWLNKLKKIQKSCAGIEITQHERNQIPSK